MLTLNPMYKQIKLSRKILEFTIPLRSTKITCKNKDHTNLQIKAFYKKINIHKNINNHQFERAKMEKTNKKPGYLQKYEITRYLNNCTTYTNYFTPANK